MYNVLLQLLHSASKKKTLYLLFLMLLLTF